MNALLLKILITGQIAGSDTFYCRPFFYVTRAGRTVDSFTVSQGIERAKTIKDGAARVAHFEEFERIMKAKNCKK